MMLLYTYVKNGYPSFTFLLDFTAQFVYFSLLLITSAVSDSLIASGGLDQTPLYVGIYKICGPPNVELYMEAQNGKKFALTQSVCKF